MSAYVWNGENRDFSVVGDFLDDFGSHPEGSADYGVALGEGGVELGRYAKVGDFGFSFLGEENITRFDVLPIYKPNSFLLDGSSCLHGDTKFLTAQKPGYTEFPAH